MMRLDTARLQNLAAALTQDKAALEAQGVAVPEGTLHDDIPALIAKIQRIEIQSGSIVPTEDMTTVTINVPANAKAIFFEAEDEEAVKAAGANYALTGRASWMHDNGKFSLGVCIRWNGSNYATSTMTPNFNGQEIVITLTYPLAAGVKYNYWVYSWEEAQIAPECTNLVHFGGERYE